MNFGAIVFIAKWIIGLLLGIIITAQGIGLWRGKHIHNRLFFFRRSAAMENEVYIKYKNRIRGIIGTFHGLIFLATIVILNLTNASAVF